MNTNVRIDDALLAKVMQLGKHRTKTAAVTHAVAEYVRRLEQLQVTELFGAVDYDRAYDYKTQRGKS